MDKYEKLINQGIRRLELQGFLSGTSDQVRSIIDDLELAPVDPEQSFRKLEKESIPSILEEMGFTCKVLDEDLLDLKLGEEQILIGTSFFPVISLNLSFRIEGESSDSIECLRQAAFDITAKWCLVKSSLINNDTLLVVSIEVMHEDEASFRHNLRFYLETLDQAMEDLRKRHIELIHDHKFGRYMVKPQGGKTVS